MCGIQQGAHDQDLLVGYELFQLVIFRGGANGAAGVQHALVQHEHLPCKALPSATSQTETRQEKGIPHPGYRMYVVNTIRKLGNHQLLSVRH